MKKKMLLVIALALSAAFIFAACGKSGSPRSGEEGAESEFLASSGRKIIYTASFTISCRDFENCKNIVEKSLEADEWFDYVSYSDGYASFEARVKTERLDKYIKGVSDSVGADKINYYTKTARDVSLDYYDKEGQIEALETEQTRLTALMADVSTTVSDLILINTRLSQVEYELAKIRGELNKYDDKLEYSVVYITIEKITYGWVIALSVVMAVLLAGVPVALTIYSKQRKKNY